MGRNHSEYVVTPDSAIETILCQIWQFSEPFWVGEQLERFRWVFNSREKQIKLYAFDDTFDYGHSGLANLANLADIGVLLNSLHENIEEVLSLNQWRLEDTNTVDVSHCEVDVHVVRPEYNQFENAGPLFTQMLQVSDGISTGSISRFCFQNLVAKFQQMFQVKGFFMRVLENGILVFTRLLPPCYFGLW